MYLESCTRRQYQPKTQTAEYWDKQGIIAENAKNYKEAVDNYTHAIMLNAKYADAYYGRGIAAEKLGWTDGALLDFDDAIKLNLPMPICIIAEDCLNLNWANTKPLLKIIQASIGSKPNFIHAYYNRGYANYHIGLYSKAIEDYTKVIELNRKFIEAYNDRGNAECNLGYFRAALEDFETSIKLYGIFSLGYYNKGHAEYVLKKYKEAIADFTKTIELSPERC